MSDSPDNVVRIGGGGGLLYEDAREQARQMGMVAAEDFVTGFTEATKPEPEPKPKGKPKTKPVAEPPKSTAATPKNLPEPPEEPGRDWREFFSTCVELLGVTLISVGGWLIAPYVGLIVAGIALIVLGVATSRMMSGDA